MTTTNAEIEALIEIVMLAVQYMFTLVPGLDEEAIKDEKYQNQSAIRFEKFVASARSRIEKGGVFPEIFSKP